MSLADRYANPLIVVVSKFDIWRSLTPTIDAASPIELRKTDGVLRAALRLDKIREASAAVRRVLLEHTPEFPLAAEQFASNVVYIPTSATGVSPVHDAKTRQIGFRAGDLKPIWAEVPMLYALSQTTRGVVPTVG